MKVEKIPKTVEIELKDKVLHFYFLNKNKVHGYATALLIAFMLAIIYITAGPGAKESIQAKQAFEEWKKSPSDQKLSKEMKQALKKFPGFDKSVQSQIAQVLLTDGQVQNAIPIAEACIERLKEDSPLHAAFAEASLFIETKEYQKALEASVALKERIEGTMETGQLKKKGVEIGAALYAWNLLRIAFLQKELHNQPGELSAWEDVKALMQVEGASAGKFLEINFGQKNFSLKDFISQRERSIVE